MWESMKKHKVKNKAAKYIGIQLRITVIYLFVCMYVYVYVCMYVCMCVCICNGRAKGPTATLEQGLGWKGANPKCGIHSISEDFLGLGPPSLALPFFSTTHICLSNLLFKSWFLFTSFTPCISTSSPPY